MNSSNPLYPAALQRCRGENEGENEGLPPKGSSCVATRRGRRTEEQFFGKKSSNGSIRRRYLCRRICPPGIEPGHSVWKTASLPLTYGHFIIGRMAGGGGGTYVEEYPRTFCLENQSTINIWALGGGTCRRISQPDSNREMWKTNGLPLTYGDWEEVAPGVVGT